MRRADAASLALLAALWGGSFPFMRIAVPEFGPLPLIALRTGIGAAVLLPLLLASGRARTLGDRPAHLFAVGLFNTAIPFVLYAWAQQSLTAGFTSILNATTPFWAALVAWLWLGDRLDARRVAGLVIGFCGVVILAWDKASFRAGGSGWAVAAALVAPLNYGIATSWNKRFLAGAQPLACAAASQLAAVAVVAPFAVAAWPDTMPSMRAWVATLLLGTLCTGAAYLLFFRLLARIGGPRTTTVTFLIPAFAIAWGGVLLGEQPTVDMALGGLVVLAGTALTLGLGARRTPATLRAGAPAPDPSTAYPAGSSRA